MSVSVRNICDDKALQISPGNFTYYFNSQNSKGELLEELYNKMINEIYQVVSAIPVDHASIVYFLETHRQIFFIQHKYKFFYLNMFQILTHFERLRKLYLQRYEMDRMYARQMVQLYQEKGVLISNLDESIIEKIIDLGYILNNSWLLDAEIHFQGDMQKKMRHYLEICCGRLEPYLTSKAKKEYDAYLSDLD